MSRDRGEGRATGQPQGGWTRGVLEQYVAGSDTRGRPGGRAYPRSQQTIREISGLGLKRHLSTLLSERFRNGHSSRLPRHVT